MAIITTTETIPAYGNHRAQTITRTTGETDYVRPKRSETPPPPKQVPLTLDEVRDLLAGATEKLATMDEEIKQITGRSTEVRLKLSDNERALVSALEHNKAVLAAYSRGKADDKAVSQGKADVRDLEDLISGLKDVTVVIASELAALQEPREKQNKLMNSYHDLAWSRVADIEREKAQPFLMRAYFCQMQSRGFGRPTYDSKYPESASKTVIPDLLNEYNLPPR